MFKEKIEHAVGLDGVDETHFIFTTVYRMHIYIYYLNICIFIDIDINNKDIYKGIYISKKKIYIYMINIDEYYMTYIYTHLYLHIILQCLFLSFWTFFEFLHYDLPLTSGECHGGLCWTGGRKTRRWVEPTKCPMIFCW